MALDMNQNPPSEPQLYAARAKIMPKAVTGFFRTLKWRIMLVTLSIYYITPWLRWDRGEGQPDQAVLVDLANRRFYFFFVEIWPQEFWFVAGMLVMAGIGLFLVTSVMGRAWCGYACPQTVWTDLFLHVERWIEGDRNAQIRLERQGWTPAKIAKRVSKHAIFLAIAVATGGAWVFYFADAPTLLGDLVTGQAPAIAYATIGVLTFTTYALGGLMREQVCIYMCPWPRIQGAMLDENSLTVTYNDWRGEPRGKHRKSTTGLGDCIDCNACVNVCPTGVDIRAGQQIGCITCGLCIDACDEMMEKVDLAKGLIGYSTLKDHEAARHGKPAKSVLQQVIRPRTVIYFGIWALVGVALLLALAMRDRLTVNVRHDRNPVFVQLSDGSVRNAYTIKVANKRPEARVFDIGLDGLPGATMQIAGAEDVPSRHLRLSIGADQVKEARLLVTVPADSRQPDPQSFRILVDDLFGSDRTGYTTNFVTQ